MTSRRVVFVSQRFPPDKGGNAARVHDITAHFDDEWDVTVLAPPPSYPPGEFDRSWTRKQTEDRDGVTVHRLWSWQPQTEDPGMARRLAYYLVFGIHAMCWLLWHVREYDCVVTTTPPISTGAPGLLAAALGTPWVVDVRDLWIDASISLGYLTPGSLIERVSRRFQRRVLHAADRIAVTTEALGDSLQQKYGQSLAAKTILVPNGVDVRRFQPSAEGDSDEPQATTDGGRATIIYTGNLGSAQALGSCVRAMSRLPEDAAVLRLVGSGDRESQLRRLTDELEVQDQVEFHGLVPREEVPALLDDATLGVAALEESDELSYAMPTKLYEYMASGLPSVVTGRGEIERFVEDNECGLHADAEPAAIAEAFERLLDDDGLRRELGANGRACAEQEYDRKAIADAFADELGTLIDESNA
ncbi:glycosyltransferase [Halovenus sp. WSH3]|uniref:Glycosyltransferase n=1 Tax=Halovenus carboxidivorans TaxID=2692199 RepID=A0A6B0TDI5_9EURY|nr:glycosyltransferase family 4 protein [Halovenus carboxidivorans]MXR52990.1 glycosyltransferase [Halovenus carboxidivorans]